MNADENFDSLKKLLALKRHELPPPGYFNDLPRRITTRLERGETAPAASLWETIFALLGRRPAFVYSFLVLISGVLVFGMVFAARVEPPATNAAGPGLPAMASGPLSTPMPATGLSTEPVAFNGLASSTNPVAAGDLPSLFDGRPALRLNVQPVSSDSQR